MRDDFAIFILTHGRPDRQITLNTLKSHRYTGKVYLVIDDEDESADRYKENYGSQVLQFCKAEYVRRTDDGGNFGNTGSPLYARNACFDLAEDQGLKYFLVLDDDYMAFGYRVLEDGTYGWANAFHTLEDAVEAMLDFYIDTPILSSFAMSQGGDHIGGEENMKSKGNTMLRKAMNSFFCSTDRRFWYSSLMNDDVTTYVVEQQGGKVFGTTLAFCLIQPPTQAQGGGITELYLERGTYVKSFYTVMFAPSGCQIATLASPKHGQAGYMRIHHAIDWDRVAPKILRESHRKS